MASSSGWPRCLRMALSAALQEIGVVDAGDFDRVLEGEEQPFAGALLGVHLQQVLAVVEHLARGDVVAVAAGQDAGERALAASRWAP